MNPFEKFPQGGEEEKKLSTEEMIKMAKEMERPLTEEEQINLGKKALASEQLEEERGRHFLEMDANDAAVLLEQRVKENDEKLAKEIEELTS